MKQKLPILIIIPHGGTGVPEELAEYVVLRPLNIFMEADSCANELFDFRDRASAVLDASISRLFVDLDRPFQDVRYSSTDGVIKYATRTNRPVFEEPVRPDEIAIANLLRRYYVPFHDAVKKILDTGGIRLILECHTVMPVGPKLAPDAGRPRPLVSITYQNRSGTTCDEGLALSLLRRLEKGLEGEDSPVGDGFVLNRDPGKGHILDVYGRGPVPMMRISLSKSLFLNEKYFSLEYLTVDELRLEHLRERIRGAVERFYAKDMA